MCLRTFSLQPVPVLKDIEAAPIHAASCLFWGISAMRTTSNEAHARPSPIEGLKVQLRHGCKCGGSILFTASGREPHRVLLLCAQCNRDCGWMSSEAAKFLHEIVEHIGRPTEVIKVRQQQDAEQ